MRGRQSSPSCNRSPDLNGSPSRNASRGFTLVELVITIVVGSVVVAFMALFIETPMSGYLAQTRRATLVDEADGALRFMGRDIKSALPNSVRVTTSGTVTAVEFLATLDGARYVDGAPLANPALTLDFTSADTAFSTAVPFSQITLPYSSSSAYLAIYNVGVPGANAYQTTTPNVITPQGTTINISAGATANQDLVTMSPGFQFAYGSPQKRVYLVSGPVSYLCDTSAGTLTRYSGYSITSSQSASAAALTAAGATASQVTGDVASCTFTYNSGTASRNALVELSMQFSNSGETVQLLYEVQLVNSP
jgi:MSHA biogenesis protein MshO